MSVNEVATIAAASEAELTQLAVLLGMDPRQPKTRAMVMVAHRYGLDPLLKHVVVIPNSGPYITRDGLLHVAHRSGVFDGIELVDGPRLEDRQWVASVRVWRKDMTHPFVYPGRYPSTGGNAKYAPEMAIKVAECMALRRAFDIAGMPVLEERQVGFPDDDIEPHPNENPAPRVIPAIAGGSDTTSDPDRITESQRKKLWHQMGPKGADLGNDETKREWMASILGVDPLGLSTTNLTRDQFDLLLAELKLLIGRGADRTRPPARPDGGEASPAPDQWTVDPVTGELQGELNIPAEDEK